MRKQRESALWLTPCLHTLVGLRLGELLLARGQHAHLLDLVGQDILDEAAQGLVRLDSLLALGLLLIRLVELEGPPWSPTPASCRRTPSAAAPRTHRWGPTRNSTCVPGERMSGSCVRAGQKPSCSSLLRVGEWPSRGHRERVQSECMQDFKTLREGSCHRFLLPAIVTT